MPKMWQGLWVEGRPTATSKSHSSEIVPSYILRMPRMWDQDQKSDRQPTKAPETSPMNYHFSYDSPGRSNFFSLWGEALHYLSGRPWSPFELPDDLPTKVRKIRIAIDVLEKQGYNSPATQLQSHYGNLAVWGRARKQYMLCRSQFEAVSATIKSNFRSFEQIGTWALFCGDG